jgi:hypothetical protein
VSGRIIVHSLDHARAAVAAAAALGRPVTLVSASSAGAYAGPLWFKAVVEEAAASFPGTAVTAVIDCGAAPGFVLAALRTGFRRVIFTGPDATRARLTEIAAAQGAVIEPRAAGLLDLLDVCDAEAACRAYLADPRAG